MNIAKARNCAHFVVCGMAGLLLAILPHLIMLYKTGAPYYVADHDDFLYLSVADQSYSAHPFSLADPMFEDSEKQSIYPYLQFAPGILAARFVTGSPLWINFFWRVFAGVSIGFAWALLVGEVVKSRLLATCLGVVLLSDAGVMSGHLFIKPLLTAAQLIVGKSGSLFALNPQLMLQWRIISPGLSLAYLLFYLWASFRLREEWTPVRLGLAGLSFGLLFYAYFYYWTAAAAALAVCFLLDAGSRKTYAWTAAVGGLIGAPAIWAGFEFKNAGRSNEWLQRTDNFLPIPHLSELLLPVLAISTVVVSFFWIYYRRRQFLPFWAIAAVGVALANHQVITGLQIQNFHYVYVWGPAVSFVIVLAVAEGWEQLYQRDSRWTAAITVAVAAVSFSLAMWFRGIETTRSRETVRIAATLANYLSQRPVPMPLNLSFSRGGIISGDPEFVETAVAFENVRPLNAYAAMFSPDIDNNELDRRIALDRYLVGTTLEQFESEQLQLLTDGLWGPWARSTVIRDERYRSLINAFRAVEQDPVGAIRQFSISYVALAPGQHLPEGASGSFRVLQKGPSWTIWESVLDTRL